MSYFDKEALAQRLSSQVAERFHFHYERLAPEFGYETRKESAVEWSDVPENNRLLMVATVRELMREGWLDWDGKD